jgi:hypothetical protein
MCQWPLFFEIMAAGANWAYFAGLREVHLIFAQCRRAALGSEAEIQTRHYRKAPARAICGGKAARRKCSKAATILDIIRENAVHASLKAVDASRECPG